MAEEKIKISLGGEYTAGDAFSQLDSDVKSTQKSAKDMTQAFSGGIKDIAGQLDGELKTSLNGITSVVDGLAKGGLWGVLATAATVAIGYIVDKFKEAKEAAEKFAEICKNEVVAAMTSATEKFKDVSKQISDAKADAKEMLAVLNGEVATNAEMKIHELHIETLQQITDDMSKAAQNVLTANEQYEATIIKNTAAQEEAANTIKAASDAVTTAQEKRTAAENTLAELTTQRAELEQLMVDNGNGWLAERQKIQEAMSQNEYLYSQGLEDLATYLKTNKDLKVELAKVEEEHKSELDQLNAAIKMEHEATQNIEAAKREEDSAVRQLTLAQQKENEIKSACAVAYEESKKKLDEANALLEKENEAKRKKIEQAELEKLSAQERLDLMEAANKAERTSLALNIDKNYLLEEYKNLVSEGLTKEEAYAKLTERINEILKGREQVEQYCQEYGIESATIMEAFNQSMYEGNDATTAYVQAQKKLNDALEERADTEHLASEDTKSSSKDKNGNNRKSINVSVDVSEISGAVEDADKRPSAWHKAREKMSEDAKELRDDQKQMNKDMYPFIQLLKGNMPQTMGEEYIKQLKQDYSKEQLEKMYEQAMDKQMLSKQEQKRQLSIFESIKNSLENQGLK